MALETLINVQVNWTNQAVGYESFELGDPSTSCCLYSIPPALNIATIGLLR